MNLQPSPFNAGPSRVLIVDDNIDLAHATSTMFKVLGHETAIAFSGEEALECIPTFSPNLVLLDLDMPGMHGLEVAKAVREMDRGSQILLAAHTAAERYSAEQACAKAGFDYFLPKPVDVEMFDRLIRSVRQEVTRFKSLVTGINATTYTFTLQQLQFCSQIVDSLPHTRNQTYLQQRIVRLDRVLGVIDRWLLKDISVASPGKLRIKADVTELRARIDPFRSLSIPNVRNLRDDPAEGKL